MRTLVEDYDIVVVGAGHAGYCETNERDYQNTAYSESSFLCDFAFI